MWNHRSEMQAAAASKGVALPQLSAQDLTDMLVYLRNLPGRARQTGVFRIEAAGSGDAVFQSAGCAKCHQTVEALADRRSRPDTHRNRGRNVEPRASHGRRGRSSRES